MVNSTIINALQHIAPVYPDFYTAKEKEYIVFTFDIRPRLFGDDDAEYNLFDVRIDYIAPCKENVIRKRVAIIKALKEIGTYPTEVNASIDEYQHYVYETEMVDVAI